MKRKRKPLFQPKKGQVAEIVCGGRQIELDDSFVPERLFHEKDSERWYAKSELRRVNKPATPPTPLSPEKLEALRKTAADSFQCAPVERLVSAPSTIPKKKCRGSKKIFSECRRWFRSRRPNQVHCSPACEQAWRKALRNAMERPVAMERRMNRPEGERE